MNLEFEYLGDRHVIPTLADYVFIFTGQDLEQPIPQEITFAFTNEDGEHPSLSALVNVLSLKNRPEPVKFKILKEYHEIEFEGQPTLFRMSDVQSNVSEVVVSL